MERALEQHLAEWPGFDWSQSNCLHFAGTWAAPEALEGVQMPSSAGEVRRCLRQAGVRNLRHAVTSRLGPEIPPALAQRGDVVLFGRTVGLCVGRLAALPLREGGVAFAPMTDATAAWRRP